MGTLSKGTNYYRNNPMTYVFIIIVLVLMQRIGAIPLCVWYKT